MFRLLIFRFRRRRAVSTIIGGLITLTLILTALGTMVFASEQYDQYQQIANKMAQYHNQQQSENLVINFPGLSILTNTAVSGWGGGCWVTYNCYNITISNLGGVGVQIARIYINSTGPAGSGCSSPNPQPCILNPSSTIASYTFSQATQFLNPGETNHAVDLALPISLTLPNPSPATPQNMVLIVTSRGNVFSFQWPFQLQIFGQSQSAFSSGIMKVAYQGADDSIHDYSGASGHTAGTFCHNEPLGTYPAGSNYAEKLTIPVVTITRDSGVLTFVNPWITLKFLQDAINCPGGTCGNSNSTEIFIYVYVINTGSISYKVASGSIDLTWYGSNHLDGTLFGIYYGNPGTFYAAGASPSITPGASYYALYTINKIQFDKQPGGSSGSYPSQNVMFWGSASVTTNTEDQSYYSGTILLSGLWVRYSCST